MGTYFSFYVVKRIAYSIEEISAIKTFFAAYIDAGNVPGHEIVQVAQKKYSMLEKRSTSSIRSKVFSMIKKKL